jgi:uncharacterized ubiquitin-like protein YukD
VSCLTAKTYNLRDNITIRTLNFNYEALDFNIDTKSKIKMYIDGYNQSKKLKVSSIDKSSKEC